MQCLMKKNDSSDDFTPCKLHSGKCGTQDGDELVPVQRTFLNIPTSHLADADSVVQSTTEAQPAASRTSWCNRSIFVLFRASVTGAGPYVPQVQLSHDGRAMLMMGVDKQDQAMVLQIPEIILKQSQASKSAG